MSDNTIPGKFTVRFDYDNGAAESMEMIDGPCGRCKCLLLDNTARYSNITFVLRHHFLLCTSFCKSSYIVQFRGEIMIDCIYVGTFALLHGQQEI